MSFPVFPDKNKFPSILTADLMLKARRLEGSLGKLPAPDTVLLCMHPGLIKYFWLRHSSRHVKSFLGDLYLLNQTKGRVAVAGNFGIGAPAAVILAEELVAWGSKRLVILGSAGGLQPGMQAGDVVIVERAVRDEGTSYHYLPAGKFVNASGPVISALSNSLVKNGIDHSVGTTWSTDAPYRETREEAVYFRNEGVQAVDMESAGLFAMGSVRNIETASVLVVGDRFSDAGWSMPVNLYMLHQRLNKLLEILIAL